MVASQPRLAARQRGTEVPVAFPGRDPGIPADFAGCGDPCIKSGGDDDGSQRPARRSPGHAPAPTWPNPAFRRRNSRGGPAPVITKPGRRA
jgi:hypothetical protein